VVFVSEATDLTDRPDTPDTPDLFLMDRVAGTTVWIGYSDAYPTIMDMTISADGRYVVYMSGRGPDGTVFGYSGASLLYDRETGITTAVSQPADPSESVAATSISADGSTIVIGYTRLGAFRGEVVDRATMARTVWSRPGEQVVGIGWPSPDGTKIVYKVPDGVGTYVMLHDTVTATSRAISYVPPLTIQLPFQGNVGSIFHAGVGVGLSVDDDGDAMWSEIGVGPDNSLVNTKVRRYDATAGYTSTVQQADGNKITAVASVAGDGQSYVLMTDVEVEQPELFGTGRLSRFDRDTNRATPISATPIDFVFAAMSADGDHMVFTSPQTDLTADADQNGDGADLFMWSRDS